MKTKFAGLILAATLCLPLSLLLLGCGETKGCHQHVNRHRDPDLSLHRILAGPVEGLDAQVLLDPFEEQFDLPRHL
jgi:hypothetical protein